MKTKQFKIAILPLANRIYPMAKRMLNSDVEAEDAVQEIMLKLWNNRKKLAKHSNPIGFALFTARNHCLDQLKKHKAELLNEPNQNFLLNMQTREGKYESREAVSFVQEILTSLPKMQREVISLKDFDGFDVSEIAEMLEQKESNVRMLLSRARKAVREKMTKIYDYDKSQTGKQSTAG